MRKLLTLFLLLAPLFAIEPTNEMVKAIKNGDINTLKTLINSKDEANAALPNGKTILMLSVWEGKLDVARYLIEKGADVNSRDSSGKTPLMLAIWRENLEMAKLLLSKGSDKLARTNDGLGIADIAELTGNGEIIDYINTLIK